MKKISMAVLGLSAFAVIAPVSAQEDGEAEATEAAEAKKPSSDHLFSTLPFCRRVDGLAEVKRPGGGWESVEEGRFYPLGSYYRAIGAESKIDIQFGPDIIVTANGDSSFGTRIQKLGEQVRGLVLDNGEIVLTLPRNLPEGVLTVAAPGFTVGNPTGESCITYKRTGDGDVATVKCVTGTLAVEGRHFKAPAMHAADCVQIRTAHDLLFTGLYGLSGDYDVVLDQGQMNVRDVETGESKVEERTLSWKMSPRTAVRIHRAVPAVGEAMSVTVMTFDAAGRLKNRCAFAEGLAALTTGEQGPVLTAERDELAKKAAAATETTTTEEAEEGEQKSEENSEESKDE